MRRLLKFGLLVAATAGARRVYGAWRDSGRTERPRPHVASGREPARPGRDTPTGTDPEALYVEPGYHDKSFGQAVDQDAALVAKIVEEEGDDLAHAEERFERESIGAPARRRQREEGRAPE